ncbi:hypothetical protein QYE76_003491 [Lolium multiflorum]|uniref:Uncharacterized protein n=1 Tax=Lolium multiflorum TaxID=4521 RepID=A0AAD8W1M5_LOLMU|nr:hypothetical protein QYE76_003491 [Lolium multiflorum]
MMRRRRRCPKARATRRHHKLPLVLLAWEREQLEALKEDKIPYQPPELNEDEALRMAIVAPELEDTGSVDLEEHGGAAEVACRILVGPANHVEVAMFGVGVARKQHAGAVAFPSWVKQAAVGASPACLVERSLDLTS